MRKALKKILTGIIHRSGTALRYAAARAGIFPRRRWDPGSVEKILVISLHYLGDVIFTTPVLKALKESFPGARVAVWVKSRSRRILKHNPSVDEVIVFDGVVTDRTREGFGSVKDRIGFARKLKKKRFDLLIDLSGVLDSILIGIASGASFRAGFSSQGLGFLLDREIPSFLPGRHLVERNLRVLAALGVERAGTAPEFFLSREENEYAEKFLKENGIGPGTVLVGVHPGAGWETKRWPERYFARLIDILEDREGIRVILFSGPGDREIIENIRRTIKALPLFAPGGIGLGELGALISRCAVYVGNDTGPTHIAGALGVATLVLFGSTNPVYCAPRGERVRIAQRQLSCRPGGEEHHCRGRAAYRCPSRACLKGISPAEVAEAVEEMICGYR